MNQLYTAARENFANGQLSWSANNWSVLLVDANYTFSAAHTKVADINLSSRVGGLKRIENKTTTDGFLNGSSVAYEGLSHNVNVQCIVIVREGASEADADLVAYYDTVDGLPWLPDGDNYTVFPDALFGGFFRL